MDETVDRRASRANVGPMRSSSISSTLSAHRIPITQYCMLKQITALADKQNTTRQHTKSAQCNRGVAKLISWPNQTFKWTSTHNLSNVLNVAHHYHAVIFLPIFCANTKRIYRNRVLYSIRNWWGNVTGCVCAVYVGPVHSCACIHRIEQH